MRRKNKKIIENTALPKSGYFVMTKHFKICIKNNLAVVLKVNISKVPKSPPIPTQELSV